MKNIFATFTPVVSLETPRKRDTEATHDVVQSQAHEAKNGPPHADDFARQIAALQAEEASHADEPVTADGAQEDHVEGGRHLLLGGVRNDLGLVGIGAEDVAVPEDDGDHEERSGQVSPEADEPVEQHAQDGQPPVQDGDGGVLGA